MPSSALLFPGQGSHADGMDEPYRGTPLFERGLELLGYDPFEQLSEGTRYQQPALFLCSVAAWEAWREKGDEEDEASAAAGHSLGEYAALVAAGALQFEDAVRLVDERASAMADAGEQNAGGMIAMLGGDGRSVRELASRLGLVVANDNAPGQLVLSGASDAVGQAEELARDETGARARRLDVSAAFHSPLMQPAAARLAAALERIELGTPAFPVYANGSASPFTDVRRELSENLLRPVRWRETLLALRTARIERFVELGPGEVLTGLVKRTLQAAA
jgi:[acyl-carrier-protein] S-malonyltransferase